MPKERISGAKRSLTYSFYSAMIEVHNKSDDELATIAERYKDIDFALFRPFFQSPGALEESLKKHSYASMFFIFIMLWRRIVLLFTAMFLTNHAWL